MNLKSVQCMKCRKALPASQLNVGITACPICNTMQRSDVFPAFFRDDRVQAESILVEDEASCFFHADKKAIVACESCGRFVCRLCEVQLGNQRICPNCVEVQIKKNTVSPLESQRFLWHKMAFLLAVVNLLFGSCFLSIPGIAAVVLAVISLRKPRLIYQRSALWNRLLAVLSILVALLGIFVTVIIFARLFVEL